MFKLLFRSIVASLLSITLITQAVAETSTQNYNSDGTVSTTVHNKKFEGFKDDPNMLASATMAMLALIAVRLATYKSTTDTMIAIAGGIAFLLGEMTSTKEVNATTMDIVTKSAGAQDEVQLAKLRQMKAAIDEALKGTKAKKGFQQTASIAFMLAGVVALSSFLEWLMAEATCLMANITADTTCTTVMCSATLLQTTAGVTQNATRLEQDVQREIPAASLSKEEEHTTEAAQNKTTATTETAASATRSTACTTNAAALCASSEGTNCGWVGTAAEGIASCNAAKAAATASCESADTILQNNITSGTLVIAKSSQPKSKFYAQIETLIDFIFPRAHSSQKDASLLWGASGALTGLLMTSAMGKFTDTLIFTPTMRGITWLTFGLLTDQAVQASQKVIDDLEKQSKDLETIIASMTNSSVPRGGPASNPLDNLTVGPSAIMPVTVSPYEVSPQGGDKKFPCALSGGIESVCPSMASEFKNHPNFSNLPPDVGNAGTSILTSMDKSLASKSIGPDAFGNSNQRATSLNDVNKMLAAVKEKVNSQLTKMGKNTIDFNQATKDLAGKFTGITLDPTTLSSFSVPTVSAKPGVKDGSLVNGTKAGSKIGGTGGVSKSGGSGTSSAKKSNIPNFNLNGNNSFSDPSTPAEAAPVTPLDPFEINYGDVSKDSETSLFKVISARYLKSGYPLLLEEVPAKIPVAPLATKKKN